MSPCSASHRVALRENLLCATGSTKGSSLWKSSSGGSRGSSPAGPCRGVQDLLFRCIFFIFIYLNFIKKEMGPVLDEDIWKIYISIFFKCLNSHECGMFWNEWKIHFQIFPIFNFSTYGHFRIQSMVNFSPHSLTDNKC